MTALVFIIKRRQVCMAMDTLVIGADDKMPLSFQRKFSLFPEHDLVVAGTGHAGFINGWFKHLSSLPRAKCIDELNIVAPDIFKESVSAEGGLSGFTATIYHFGYSIVESQYVGYAFRSTADFQPERLPHDCLGVKPEVKVVLPENIEVPGLFIALLQQQQNEDRLLPLSQRAGIGGEVEFVVLRNRSFHIETVHRFATYESERKHIESRKYA